MLMSILHRITGAALYVGTLLVAWWLIAASTSESYFHFVDGILSSWFGLIVLFGYTWALMFHLLGGVRHLIWDTGHGLEKDTSTALAWATLAGSALLTLAVWAGYLLAGS
jgi:succinate dehydrogenase / fumarate reductase cytochrome b subunit